MSSLPMRQRSTAGTPRRFPAPELKMITLLLMLLLVNVGCTSQPLALPPECPQSPTPPAWMMERQPSSVPLLDSIISPSEAS